MKTPHMILTEAFTVLTCLNGFSFCKTIWTGDQISSLPKKKQQQQKNHTVTGKSESSLRATTT